MIFQNFVMIEGRTGTDIEIKKTGTGEHRYCNFVLCYNKIKKNKESNGPEWLSEPCFFQVTAWDKLADACQNIAKGEAISVVGKLDYSFWQDESGKKQSKIFITASSIHKIYIENKKAAKTEEIPALDESEPEFNEPFEEDYISIQ